MSKRHHGGSIKDPLLSVHPPRVSAVERWDARLGPGDEPSAELVGAGALLPLEDAVAVAKESLVAVT